MLAVVFYYGFTYEAKLTPFLKIVSRLMLLYLLFSLARNIVLLVFSFGEYFFRRLDGNPTHFPMVSVIVPCFNEEKVVRAAIDSISKIDYPNFEIIVVDDGSIDLTLDLAKTREEKFRTRVVYQENAGKAAALNRGISEAVGEFVFCMDADSLLKPNVLKLGIDYFEHRPGLAAVAGSVVVGNATNFVTLLQKLEYVIGLNFHKTAQSFLSMVTIVPGPIGLFKRSAVLGVGGYHSDTFAEDCDLTMRLLMAGYEIAYCPKMIAVTEAPDDFWSLITQRYRWSRGVVQALVKNARWFFSPIKNFRNFSILTYMTLESIVMPTINFTFAMITIETALLSDVYSLFGQFFAGLTVLDMILALYCVWAERENVILVALAAVNRVTYGLALEVLRFFAVIDEVFGIPMNWGKLVRKGLT